jgi:hypothetical protein
VNCGPLYPLLVGKSVPPDCPDVACGVGDADVALEVVSDCANDVLEGSTDSGVEEEDEVDVIEAAALSCEELVVTVASGMREVERTVSSDCVIIGFPFGSTKVMAGCVLVSTIRDPPSQ